MAQDYEPFGPQWEKNVMRMTKRTIMLMYKKVCMEKIVLEELNENQRQRLENGEILCKKD